MPRPVQGPVMLRMLRSVSDVAHVGSHAHAYGVCSAVSLCPFLLVLCLACASSQNWIESERAFLRMILLSEIVLPV